MQSKTFAIRSRIPPKLVRNAGPIICMPVAQAMVAAMFMPIAVILSVGVDLALSISQSQLWQSAGYRLTAADSIRDAIDNIRYGDFDLVLMGDSIRLCDRERLTFLIRALSSCVPVVCVTDSPSDCAAFADATVKNDPIQLLQCVGELLAAQAGKRAANRGIIRADC
jgi:hypothetical protein